jgi:hypothetical protein
VSQLFPLYSILNRRLTYVALSRLSRLSRLPDLLPPLTPLALHAHRCGYHSEGGSYVQSQTVTLIAVLLWRPLSSLLTDALPTHNHTLLVTAASLELIGLLIMLLLVALSPANGLSPVSPWSVLGLSVFKQCTEVQLSNSIFKIFKMRLTHTCGLSR